MVASLMFLRVTMSTLVISLIVVIVVGALLIGRITSGLLDAKVNASLGRVLVGIHRGAEHR